MILLYFTLLTPVHASLPDRVTQASYNSYLAGCLFTAMRLCSERWPIGPYNRYDCYNDNIDICELEADAYKKWLSPKNFP